MSDPENEPTWVHAAQAGSADAFSRLVTAHSPALRAFLRRLTGNWTEADDVAQETFVFAWRAITRFDHRTSFRAWLFGIAWRKSGEARRQWWRRMRREQAAMEMAPGAVEDQPVLRLELAAALGALSRPEQAAILLCLGAGFSHAEAAEALALPLGSLKSHVARGREKLAVLLGETDAVA